MRNRDKLLKAEQLEREFFREHETEYKTGDKVILTDKIVMSFMDMTDKYTQKYVVFTQNGMADIGFLNTMEEAIIAATLNLTSTDINVLKMIMAAKRKEV